MLSGAWISENDWVSMVLWGYGFQTVNETKYKLFHTNKCAWQNSISSHCYSTSIFWKSCSVIKVLYNLFSATLSPSYRTLQELLTGNHSPTTYSYKCYAVCLAMDIWERTGAFRDLTFREVFCKTVKLMWTLHLVQVSFSDLASQILWIKHCPFSAVSITGHFLGPWICTMRYLLQSVYIMLQCLPGMAAILTPFNVDHIIHRAEFNKMIL